MPILYQKPVLPQGELGIWKIKESESYFLDRLVMDDIEKVQFDQLKGRRRIEWLASRWLLHKMSGRDIRGACLKDDFGKPFLVDSSYHISLSHSHELVSVIASPFIVGIDIQFIVSKIGRLANKFLNPDELKSLSPSQRIEHLHVYWGAKEALYKAYGKKLLDFKENIEVGPFELDPSGAGKIKAAIRKDNYSKSFMVYYQKLGHYFLVYCVEGVG